MLFVIAVVKGIAPILKYILFGQLSSSLLPTKLALTPLVLHELIHTVALRLSL